MNVAETQRLRIRRMTLGDAAFFCRQLNQPSWIANIGDRKVRTIADAAAYLEARTLPIYAELGFGMYLVERKTDGVPIGLCGLVKRDVLPGPDLGFSLLEEEWGQGYAREAAAAVVAHAFDDLGLPRLLAIVLPANGRSSSLLEQLGFTAQGWITQNTDKLRLYSLDSPRAAEQ